MAASNLRGLKRLIYKGGFFDERAFRVTAGRYTYYVRINPIRNMGGGIDGYEMDVGGRQKGCITIRVPKSVPGYSNNHNIALIRSIKYNPMCSVHHDLEVGIGTKHMIKTALSIVQEVCPGSNIHTYRLWDVSRKIFPDGTIVSLPYYMIATTGKTYYEKNFSARFEEDTTYEKYKLGIARLQQVPRDTKPFSDFQNSYNIPAEYKEIYDRAGSYMEFFQEITKIKGPKAIAAWVNNFVVQHLFDGNDMIYYNHWNIAADAVARIQVDGWTRTEDGNDVFQVEDEDIKQVRQLQQHGSGSGPTPTFKSEDPIPDFVREMRGFAGP